MAPTFADDCRDISPDVTEFYFSQLPAVDLAYLTGPRNYPDACPWCGGRYKHSEPCEAIRQASDPVLEFGKHKGRRVSEAPIDYLQWAMEKSDRLDDETREAIERRLATAN